MTQPLVTIVTPSFNQGEFIERTIKSVLNQTYAKIQYIVVDGGSTDSTLDILSKYNNDIDIVISEKDNGQSDAINKGFKLAEGEIVGWINSDDTLEPNCVEEIVKLYIKHHSDGVIFSTPSVNIIDENDNIIRTTYRRILGRDDLIYNNYSVVQQGSFYSTKALKEINYIDETLNFCMDLDLFVRLLSKGDIFYTKAYSLANFRSWSETKTNTSVHDFSNEIESTIKKYGAGNLSKSVLHLKYILLRVFLGKVKRRLGLN